ncbi:MAG: aminotransferase class I/II-fold pyridoxal phosphate-dependent enzyme [Bryobacteraceae bacterium]
MEMMTHGGNLFAAAERAGLDWRQILDFSASINPLGMSPASREAILTSIDRVTHYPERSASRLRQRLAEEWNVPANRIAAGNGATELLFAWCRRFATGTIVVPTFGEFHRAWPDAALAPLEGPWPDCGPVAITRPANPTGALVDPETVLRYAYSRRDPVLVDESFIEFCDTPSLVSHAGGNLFVLRSLTKFHALPGLRVGALVGDVAELSEAPWSVNVLAEAAAIASLDDRDHARRTREFVRSESKWLFEQLRGIAGLHPHSPTANYVYAEAARASDLTAFAAARNVLIRDCTGWPGLPAPAIRVAVRNRWENEILIALCKEFACRC